MIRRAGNTKAGRALENTMRTYEAKAQSQIHHMEKNHVDQMRKATNDAWESKYKNVARYKELNNDGKAQYIEDIGTIGNLIKHGPERNAEIFRKTEAKDKAGSGRTNEQIASIEKKLRKEAPGLVELYEKIYADHMKPMMALGDRARLDAGLLTPEAIAARPKYKWYVPLYGDPDAPEGGSSSSSGANLKSPKDKKAMGRSGTLPDHPFVNSMMQAARGIKQGEMERFKREFVEFLEAHPSAKAEARAKINAVDSKEIFEKYLDKDGIVRQRVKANAAMSPDAVVVRDGDKTKVANIGNPKILEAMKGMDAGPTGLGGIL